MTCHDTGFFSSFLPTPLFIKSNSLPGKWWFKDNPFLLGPKKRPFSGARLDSGRKSKYPVCMAVGDSLFEWTGTSRKGICQNENNSENYLQHHQNNWRIIFYLYQKNIQNTYHIIMLLFQNAFKGWTSFIFLFVGWRRSHFSFGIYWLQIHATAASTVEHRLRAWKCQPFDTKDENFRLGQMVLLVEEILHQLRSVLYPHYLTTRFYTSQVVQDFYHQQYHKLEYTPEN